MRHWQIEGRGTGPDLGECPRNCTSPPSVTPTPVLDGEALCGGAEQRRHPAQLEFQLPVEANAAEDLLADTVGAQPMTSFRLGPHEGAAFSNYATILRLKKQAACTLRPVLLQ